MFRFIWLYREVNEIKKRQIGADLQNHEKQLVVGIQDFFVKHSTSVKITKLL